MAETKENIQKETPEQELEKKLAAVNALLKRLSQEELTPAMQREVLEEIKAKLYDLLDNLQKKPSYLTEAAKFWAAIPTWQKVLAGFALTAPTLVLGIVFHIGILLAICCMTLVVYAAGSLLLDNHERSEKGSLDSVKQGIGGLVDLFGVLIGELKSICDELKKQVNTMTVENQRLANLNNEFSNQIVGFTNDTSLFNDLLALLGEDKANLTEGVEAAAEAHEIINDQIQQQKRILEGYRAMYQQLVQERERNGQLQQDLQSKIMSLEKQGVIIKNLAQQISVFMRKQVDPAAQKILQQAPQVFAEEISTAKALSEDVHRVGKQIEQANQVGDQIENILLAKQCPNPTNGFFAAPVSKSSEDANMAAAENPSP